MSKRYSILAAALVASGRSLSTTSLDHLETRPLERRSRQTDIAPAEQRDKPILDGLDEALLRFDLASSDFFTAQ